MRTISAFTLVFCLVLVSRISRADDPVSGPKVGEAAGAFEMELAIGDDAGKKVDTIKPLKDKPVLVIFISEMNRPGFGLLKMLDKYGRLRQPEGLEVLIVRVSDDAAGAAKHAKILYDLYDVKSTAGVAVGGKAGPKDYNLSEEAQMTVLLVDKEHKVLMNMARRAPDRQDFDEVRKSIDKLLGPSPVPFP
ncbi:MAG: hypothetical protein HY290_19045 [Planctomycetia bacterium]|nr:hypothetical protein [Planctomycetia bacterium]